MENWDKTWWQKVPNRTGKTEASTTDIALAPSKAAAKASINGYRKIDA